MKIGLIGYGVVGKAADFTFSEVFKTLIFDKYLESDDFELPFLEKKMLFVTVKKNVISKIKMRFVTVKKWDLHLQSKLETWVEK